MTPADYVIAVSSGRLGKGYPIIEIATSADKLIVYYGIAPRGTLTSQPCWIVEKVTLDGPNGQLVRSRVSPDNSIFDNYLTLSYA